MGYEMKANYIIKPIFTNGTVTVAYCSQILSPSMIAREGKHHPVHSRCCTSNKVADMFSWIGDIFGHWKVNSSLAMNCFFKTLDWSDVILLPVMRFERSTLPHRQAETGRSKKINYGLYSSNRKRLVSECYNEFSVIFPYFRLWRSLAILKIVCIN